MQDSYEYGNYTQCLKTHISYCTRSGCNYREETPIGETSHDIHYLYTAGGKEYGTCTNCGHSGYYTNSWTFTSQNNKRGGINPLFFNNKPFHRLYMFSQLDYQ